MVYREIVKKTHPDKLGTNLSESEKEDRISIYKNATIAYNKKDIGELLLCAFLAKVSFKVDDQEILMIKTTMKKCHDESSFLEQTYSWKWFYGDESMKNTLVEKFIYHHMSL